MPPSRSAHPIIKLIIFSGFIDNVSAVLCCVTDGGSWMVAILPTGFLLIPRGRLENAYETD